MGDSVNVRDTIEASARAVASDGLSAGETEGVAWAAVYGTQAAVDGGEIADSADGSYIGVTLLDFDEYMETVL